MSGYEVVTATAHSGNLGNAELLTARAACTSGKRPLGGGVQSVNALRYPTVASSYPDPVTPGWVGEIRNGAFASAGATDIVVYAVCANVQ